MSAVQRITISAVLSYLSDAIQAASSLKTNNVLIPLDIARSILDSLRDPPQESLPQCRGSECEKLRPTDDYCRCHSGGVAAPCLEVTFVTPTEIAQRGVPVCLIDG